MRAMWVAASLAVVMFAGCAEQMPEPVQDNGIEEAPVDDTNATIEAFNGTLVAAVDNTTVDAGTPFNVTLDLVGDADLANITWAVTFYNGTLGASDANATDNATADTFAINDTVVYEGVGLPAVVEANLTFIGNVTMAAAAVIGNTTIDADAILLEVLGAGGPVDPCDGVVFEPLEFSGSFTAAVAGSGFYSSNPFTVPDCVTSLHATVTGSVAMVDIMLRIRDSGNSNTYATSNARSDSTEEITWAPADGIAAGNYDLNVRGQIAGPGNYQGTIVFNPA